MSRLTDRSFGEYHCAPIRSMVSSCADSLLDSRFFLNLLDLIYFRFKFRKQHVINLTMSKLLDMCR